MDNKFLLKNPPSKDSLIKTLIKEFLLKNPSKYKNNRSTIFYKYTSETKYFIDHLPDPGGFSSNELENVDNQRLAVFDISKCETDTSKLIGEFYYYGINYDLSQIDTIIYKCN
jgi:stress response protein SCP2